VNEPIIVQGVGKQFRRYHPERPSTLIETFIHGFRRLQPSARFWALRDVSFSIPNGRMVGIIGANGAGKSTLLRLLGGIGRPDEGQIKTHGRIGALLDLGAGFHPDLTGRENLFISGVISGLTRQEVAAQFENIVAFAELQPFIDNPLRTYSTGMQMRLAFAVAVHIEPDILLIDEVLAVGDVAFQQKCLERIGQFKERGCAIVLVSHDATLVRQLCDEAIWLRDGRVTAHGPAELVVGQYLAEMSAETRRRTPIAQPPRYTATGQELRLHENRFGSLEMEIEQVNLSDPSGQPVGELLSGQPLCVRIAYNAPQVIAAPIFGVTVSREDGFICTETSTDVAGVTLPNLHGRGQISLLFERLDLVSGHYYLDVGIYEQAWRYAYDYHWHIYPLRIMASTESKGVLRPPHRWQWL
jgi:lipopolysaccharide transport system ATP-binding protein